MMACFKVITGIDLMDIKEQQMKDEAKREDEKKARKQELEKK